MDEEPLRLFKDYIVLCGMEAWVTNYAIQMLTVFNTNDLLRKLRMRRTHEESAGIRQMELSLRYHRCFGIHLGILKQVFGLANGVCHIVAIFTIVFCNYEAVRLGGMIAIGLGLMSLSWATLLLIWLDLVAEINRQSQLLLGHVERMCSQKFTELP